MSAAAGRLVVITGGAKGIGLATARQFQTQGDRVLVLGRDREALADAARTHDLETAECDVTDEAAVQRTFAQIEPVDVLVNNAGIGESAPLQATTLDEWRRHLEVNATGTFLCLREVIRGMRAQGGGAIVNVASTAGRIGVPYTAAYTASKHAVVGLTRAAAAELGGSGIRVNAVCPTFVDTDMTERTVANIVQKTGRVPADAEAALVASTPLGRLLAAEEVAAAIVYLASPGAAGISGQALVIDGGAVQA